MSERLVTTTVSTTLVATTTLVPSFEMLSVTFSETFLYYLNMLDRLPGGQIILRYIKSSYKNDPVRSLFELALVIFAIHYFLSSKKKENKSDVITLSNREIDELVDEWVPEPLVDPITEEQQWELDSIPIVQGSNGAYVDLKNSSNVANLASNDFLNLSQDQRIKDAANGVIRTTGVGACSPPNFYGTQAVHVRLEEDLARYLDAEAAILYGQDFTTASSVIPAFLKRGDLIVADNGINLAIQKALIVSRSDVVWYNHNDVDDLEQVLEELKPVLDKQKPIRRRFIITEGLFANTGDIVALPRIVELKNKYKYRLFVDESLSIGTLGKTGKGVCEHFDIPRHEVSITIGSLANAFGSSGGFCAGAAPMVHHQRISSNAYVFSAALPPYSARVVSKAIELLESTSLMASYQSSVALVHNGLTANLSSSSFALVVSQLGSPIVHVALAPEYREKLGFPEFYGSDHFLLTGKMSRHINPFDRILNIESFILQKIIDQFLRESNVLISRSKNILDHENLPVFGPHLLIHVNAGCAADVEKVISTLPRIIESVCSSITSESDLAALDQELRNY